MFKNSIGTGLDIDRVFHVKYKLVDNNGIFGFFMSLLV